MKNAAAIHIAQTKIKEALIELEKSTELKVESIEVRRLQMSENRTRLVSPTFVFTHS